MSAKLFYREFGYQEADIARFLADKHGFDTLYRTAGKPQVKRSKWFFVKQILLDVVFLALRRRKIRSYGQIVALWHSSIAFILLKRIGLLDYERLLWFGFSVRSPFWIRIVRQVARLDPDGTWFVVFTEKEVDDYAEHLGIDPEHLLFIAHGDWPQPIELPEVFARDPALDLATPYYFTGGFTNRDYRPVIEAFRGQDQRLIIVCSRSNDDVVDAELPANVQVYRDISQGPAPRQIHRRATSSRPGPPSRRARRPPRPVPPWVRSFRDRSQGPAERTKGTCGTCGT
jgi:hypothetical protein